MWVYFKTKFDLLLHGRFSFPFNCFCCQPNKTYLLHLPDHAVLMCRYVYMLYRQLSIKIIKDPVLSAVQSAAIS